MARLSDVWRNQDHKKTSHCAHTPQQHRREGSNYDVSSVVEYVAFPWNSASSTERDAPDTSGGTPQLHGGHTGRDLQEQNLRPRRT